MKTAQKIDWVPLLALLVSVISLGWQIVDKYQSKQVSLKISLNIHSDYRMVVSVTNTGSHSAFIEKPYLHIITENGKGYGFFFDDKNEKAALLS